MGGPEKADQLGARFGPGCPHLLDNGAEFGKPVGGGFYQRGDLGIDAGVAEVRAVGNAFTFDAGVQPRVIGGGAGFQGGVIQWVGAGHDLQKHRAVGDGAGQRAVV